MVGHLNAEIDELQGVGYKVNRSDSEVELVDRWPGAEPKGLPSVKTFSL